MNKVNWRWRWCWWWRRRGERKISANLGQRCSAIVVLVHRLQQLPHIYNTLYIYIMFKCVFVLCKWDKSIGNNNYDNDNNVDWFFLQTVISSYLMALSPRGWACVGIIFYIYILRCNNTSTPMHLYAFCMHFLKKYLYLCKICMFFLEILQDLSQFLFFSSLLSIFLLHFYCINKNSHTHSCIYVQSVVRW